MSTSVGQISRRSAWAGLDTSARQTIVVQAERRRGRIVCARLTTLPDAAPCAAGLSVRESFTRWLDAPFRSAAKTLKVLPTLLDIQLPFPLESCLYALVSSRRTSAGKQQWLVAVARQTDVERRLRECQAAGGDPVVLDQQGLALWSQTVREVTAHSRAQAGWRVIVHLNGDDSALVIGSGATFESCHPIREQATDQTLRVLQGTLGDAPAGSSTQWIWTGPGAADAVRLAAAQAPLQARWSGPATVVSDPATFLARALATRALLGESVACNLRTGALTHPLLRERTRRATRVAASVLLASGLLLTVGCLWIRTELHRREAALDTVFAQLRDTLMQSPQTAKGQRAVEMVRRRQEQQHQREYAFHAALAPSLCDTVVAVVNCAQTNNLRLKLLSVTPDRVSVSGTAGAWKPPETLLNLLKKRGYRVNLNRLDANHEARIPFTVEEAGS